MNLFLFFIRKQTHPCVETPLSIRDTLSPSPFQVAISNRLHPWLVRVYVLLPWAMTSTRKILGLGFPPSFPHSCRWNSSRQVIVAYLTRLTIHRVGAEEIWINRFFPFRWFADDRLIARSVIPADGEVSFTHDMENFVCVSLQGDSCKMAIAVARKT